MIYINFSFQIQYFQNACSSSHIINEIVSKNNFNHYKNKIFINDTKEKTTNSTKNKKKDLNLLI